MINSKLDITNLKNCIDALNECIEAYSLNTDDKMRGFIEFLCKKI